MQQGTSTTSGPAADHSSAPSVLDFLYHDSRRIGSFLSQFEGDGHLQSLTRTKDAGRGKKDANKTVGKANIGVASGSMEGNLETSLSMNEGYARVFDPYWANARAFLNHLSENAMLNRSIGEAEIGQFVHVKGYLSVLDLSMMKEAWKMPSIQKKALGGSQPDKPIAHMTSAEKAAYKEAQREERENSELMLEMMQILPHAIHATLLTDEHEIARMVWGALREEYLVMPASDITLAHGARMPGTWSIVGILTAYPEFSLPDLNGSVDGDSVGVMSSLVGQVSQMLAPIVRVALGRPAAAFAITPLLVFREVA